MFFGVPENWSEARIGSQNYEHILTEVSGGLGTHTPGVDENWVLNWISVNVIANSLCSNIFYDTSLLDLISWGVVDMHMYQLLPSRVGVAHLVQVVKHAVECFPGLSDINAQI